MITRRPLFSSAFFRGMAQAVDLSGGMARRRLAAFRSQRRSAMGALGHDFAALGRDLGHAMRRYRELHEQ